MARQRVLLAADWRASCGSSQVGRALPKVPNGLAMAAVEAAHRYVDTKGGTKRPKALPAGARPTQREAPPLAVMRVTTSLRTS